MYQTGYNIDMDCRTVDGLRLGRLSLRHAPDDADKIVRLRESMLANGWRGRPVVLYDAGNGTTGALSGVHRLCAAQGLDDVVNAVWLPSDLTDDDWREIGMAVDDQDLLQALEMIAEDRADMSDVIAAFEAEIDAAQAE